MNRRKEISSALGNFYQNPVAKVSMELFMTIGLVLFLAIFAIKPTITTISDLIKEIENKEKLEQQLTKKVAALQTAQSEYLTVGPLLPILDEAIPSSPEIIKSTKIIEKAAADNHVIIMSINLNELPKKPTKEVPFEQKSKESLDFSVNISGDYVSIRNFVETLRKSRKSFVIDSVIFSLEEKKGSKKLSANITINTPYFGIKDIETNKK